MFIQVNDLQGRLMNRSPNLKADQLAFEPAADGQIPLNSTLRGKSIRQRQEPIGPNDAPMGYLLAAISSEAAQHVLDSLGMMLLLSFPAVVLFAIARMLAGRSTAPIAQITAATNRITRSNLAERIAPRAPMSCTRHPSFLTPTWST